MRRVGDLKGPGSKVADVISEVFPIVDLENLPAELYALGGTVLAYGGGNVAATAGEISQMAIFNPATSGKIMTVTSAIVSHGLGTGINWSFIAAEFSTTIATQIQRDTRLGFTTLPSGLVQTESGAGFPGATGTIQVLPDTPLFLKDENGLAVLEPGTGFHVSPITVNSALFATFYWRERVMEPSEASL